ncbi:MAG: hypothetical protein HYX72_01855 [Acidobacteria bacterium]|nr:hypothetical protein [Acidobacteriota bacterium]
MRVPINLASQPYENLRPMYLAAVAGVLLVIALSLTVAWKSQQNRNDTRTLAEQSEQLDRDMVKLRNEEQELITWLGRPEVQEIRDHSAFLNSLIVRKSLSWTQIFMDLEKILPHKVQVAAIRPSPNREAQAQLNLTVSSPAVAPLIEFLKNLEDSAQFGTPVVDSQRFPAERAPDQNISLELSVLYRQGGTEAATNAREQDPQNHQGAAASVAGLTSALPSDRRRAPHKEGR